MNRKSAAAWTLCVVPVVAAGFFYARNHRVFRRALEGLQRATRAIDASLAEIQAMRDKQPDRDDAAVVERARREFKDIDFVAFAEYLQLEWEQSKQQEQ
ncbi:MAG: hypothetical protein ACTHZI_01545 [Luteimonas sp.]